LQWLNQTSFYSDIFFARILFNKFPVTCLFHIALSNQKQRNTLSTVCQRTTVELLRCEIADFIILVSNLWLFVTS